MVVGFEGCPNANVKKRKRKRRKQIIQVINVLFVNLQCIFSILLCFLLIFRG